MMITTHRLRVLVKYDETSGNLIRLIPTSNRTKAGDIIGFTGKGGYKYASLDKKTYPLHLLVWIWHEMPEVEEIDHINNDRSDNRIENLRQASRCQNMWNIRIAKNNTSGAKGVTWKADKKKWRVRIGVNGKRIHIGDFKDFEFAELVASEARNKYHGKFARI